MPDEPHQNTTSKPDTHGEETHWSEETPIDPIDYNAWLARENWRDYELVALVAARFATMVPNVNQADPPARPLGAPATSTSYSERHLGEEKLEARLLNAIDVHELEPVRELEGGHYLLRARDALRFVERHIEEIETEVLDELRDVGKVELVSDQERIGYISDNDGNPRLFGIDVTRHLLFIPPELRPLLGGVQGERRAKPDTAKGKKRGRQQKYDTEADKKAVLLWNKYGGTPNHFKNYDEFVKDPPTREPLPPHIKSGVDLKRAIHREYQRDRQRKLFNS